MVIRRHDEATTAALLEANRRIEELMMFKVLRLVVFSDCLLLIFFHCSLVRSS